MSSKPTVFIVGQTASGKTAAAIKLARAIGGEVICADSQTVRRSLNIGTAKPSSKEQEGVPHHLLDIIEPYERFSVADFQRLAKACIAEIRMRNNVPIIAGGTGLYIDSLYYDYNLTTASNTHERAKLEKLSVSQLQGIIARNMYTMPSNAQNKRHLVGVIARNNQNPKNSQPRSDALIYGLHRDESVLKQRINERVEAMFRHGLIDEVKQVIQQYGRLPETLDAIGYPIVQRYIDNDITLDEAKELFKRADWQYARRQKAWFKRNRHIQWFTDVDSLVAAAIKAVDSF